LNPGTDCLVAFALYHFFVKAGRVIAVNGSDALLDAFSAKSCRVNRQIPAL
jgi:hypothetical protein